MKQKKDFERIFPWLFSSREKELIYLDNAATSTAGLCSGSRKEIFI